MVNPGAVGQPRDGDPRAAYAVYDSEARTLTLARVEHDVDKAQRRIRDAGLPDILASFGCGPLTRGLSEPPAPSTRIVRAGGVRRRRRGASRRRSSAA